MKIPKTRNTYCKHCKIHTSHKVVPAKRKTHGTVRTMGRSSKNRLHKRGSRRGVGNQGRFSRKAIASWKMTGKKVSKKTDLRYTCDTCKKTQTQKKGKRTKRLEMI